jgi:cytoskeletal protein RodZ
MALKAGRRPDLGERAAAGEVRPVSTRLLISLTVGVVVLVVLGITAIIIASSGTKTPHVIDNNVPHHVSPSASASAPSSSPSP